MHTELIGEKELKYHIIERLKRLNTLRESGDLLMGENIIKDPVQKILINFDRSDWFTNTLVPIIEVNAIDCEKHAPGAGKLFLDLVTHDLSKSIRNNIVFKIEDDIIQNVLRQINENSTGLCHKDDYDDYIEETLGFASKDIVQRALNLFKAGDQVRVEKNFIRKTTIEKTTGYVFDNITFNPAFNINSGWKRKDVNVLLIDGIIESVGEIHHMLEKAYETGESYLLICSGILPEPLSVIHTNFLRKTIDVIVGTVDSNEFGIQTMVDLGTCCMTEPISAMKGESISQASRREFTKVDKVEVFPNKLMISNLCARDATNSLLLDVMRRAEDNNDIAYLYQKRVKSLSSSTIKVSIGRDDIDRCKSVIEEVDLFFRTSPMSLKWGFVKKSELDKLPDDMSCLLFGSQNVQPTHRIRKSLETYLSFREQVNKTGAIITTQRD